MMFTAKMETVICQCQSGGHTHLADLVGAPKHLDHPFEDYIAYLRESQSKIERAYALEKVGAL